MVESNEKIKKCEISNKIGKLKALKYQKSRNFRTFKKYGFFAIPFKSTMYTL